MTQLEITGQLILDLFKIVVHCLNRQATSVVVNSDICKQVYKPLNHIVSISHSIVSCFTGFLLCLVRSERSLLLVTVVNIGANITIYIYMVLENLCLTFRFSNTVDFYSRWNILFPIILYLSSCNLWHGLKFTTTKKHILQSCRLNKEMGQHSVM